MKPGLGEALADVTRRRVGRVVLADARRAEDRDRRLGQVGDRLEALVELLRDQLDVQALGMLPALEDPPVFDHGY